MKSTMQSPPDTAHFLLRSDGQVSTIAVIRFSIPANYNNTLVSHKPDIHVHTIMSDDVTALLGCPVPE